MSIDLQRDKFAIRKDVMILRQVVYKELQAARVAVLASADHDIRIKEGVSLKDALTLSDEDKAWIDQEVTFFFSEIPDAVMEAYRNEFSSKSSVGPAKVDDKDLVMDKGIL